MYKLLLSWRYLRSRYIALASIISVTLGVATLIVVNSVMAGFTSEMRKRLHGILSDIEIAMPGMGEIPNPEGHIKEVRHLLGDELESVSAIVRTPAMIHLDYHGRMITQQVMLIGIDEETYARVSDFGPYLMNEHNREAVSFELREDGYSDRLPTSGWPHRRDRIRYEREVMSQLNGPSPRDSRPSRSPPSTNQTTTPDQTDSPGGANLSPLPDRPPQLEFRSDFSDTPAADQAAAAAAAAQQPLQIPVRPSIDTSVVADAIEPFDEMTHQHTGIILGIALASRKFRDPETGEVRDEFLARPGDNVQLTLPTVGAPPRPVYAVCTVVDFYESKMHEYDATFAFVPISELQRIRGMIGPGGKPTVSSIQIKLKPGADLKAVKAKLEAAFPPGIYPYYIQTWQDTQKPLLAAVELEITILNILLFLIIAVAGFGILATFFMIVVEKTKDIGILKSLGATSRGVMSIFLGYGLSLGIVGTGVGIVLGLLFVVYINDIARLIEWMTGREVFDPTVYYFSEIPTIVDPITILWVACGAVMIAVMACVLPALRAARLHPVKALRYE